MNKFYFENVALTLDDVSIVPQYSEVLSRKECSLKTKISRNYEINLPLISANMETVTEFEMAKTLGLLGGLGVIHRFMGVYEQCDMIIKLKNLKLLTAAAIGVGEHDYTRALSLLNNGCDIIVIDVAHAHHILVKKMMEQLLPLKNAGGRKFDIMVGNVCTKEAIKDLIDWGADSIKINVGSGAACTTKKNVGVGIPSFTCLQECLEMVYEYDFGRWYSEKIPLIFDGGIKISGDVAKAIGGGAKGVMIGSMFAGTTESPGEIKMKGLYPNGGMVKTYRGSASYDSKVSRGESGKHVEGMSFEIPYKGDVEFIVKYIVDGLKSAMSYSGASNIEEFHNNCKFIRVSSLGGGILPHLEIYK